MSGEEQENVFETGNPLRFHPVFAEDFNRRWTQTVNRIRRAWGMEPFPETKEEENEKD